MNGMPYDKESFLAGVAAGRNMKSWPAFEEASSGAFAFTIRLTGQTGPTYEFYMVIPTAGDVFVNWGDGTITHHERNSPYAEHTYAKLGFHQIIVVGDVGRIQLGTETSSSNEYAVVSLDTPLPRGYRSLTRMCKNCKNLMRITPRLCINAKESIVEAEEVFRGCSSLTQIPDGLFDGLTNCTSFAYCFYYSSIHDIPGDLFNDCVSVRNFQDCFAITPVENIPSNLFHDCPNIVGVGSCFSECKELKSIPSDIFSHNPNIETFFETFSGCSSVESSVPTLWEDFQDADGRGCFLGCVKASNYEDIPPEWIGL